jgi:hypothetical protein
MVLGTAATVSLDVYQGHLFRSERTLIVSLLEHARTLSMNNIHESAHGVCYDPISKTYIMFTGNVCTPGSSANVTMKAERGVVVGGLFPGVIFSQLSGTTSERVIRVTSAGRTAEIAINYEGLIAW